MDYMDLTVHYLRKSIRFNHLLTWTNVDSSSVKSSDTDLEAVSQEIH